MANKRLNTPRAPIPQTVLDAVLVRKKVKALSKDLDPSGQTEARTLGVALFEYNEDVSDVMLARDQVLKLINAHRRATEDFSRIANRTSCFALPDVMVGEAMQIEGIMSSFGANLALLQRKVKVIDLALEIRFGCWDESRRDGAK